MPPWMIGCFMPKNSVMRVFNVGFSLCKAFQASSAGQWLRIKARTSWRNASSSSEKLRYRSPLLDPRSQHDFKRPSRPMLVVQLQIGFRDVVRVGHVVVDGCSRPPVGAGAVFLRPANCGVNRHICYVDALRHQFPRHALRKSGLGMACHCKGTARWVAFERGACVREDYRSFSAVRVRFVLAHEPGRLLTHQERAERRVSKCVECHTWVGFGNLLSKDAGNPAVDVVYDKRRSPAVSNNILKQQLHGRWLACIARVSPHAVRLLQVLQDRFVWVSSCDADRHAVRHKQPRTARADAWATPNDQCNVFFGRLSIVFGGCCHVSCSNSLR